MIILYAGITLGGIGLLCGLLLAVASKYLTVEVDERIEQINELLPGANCGGCGYAGCGAYATAVVEGNAPVDACVVCGNEVIKKISELIGVKAQGKEHKVAKVLCFGTTECAKNRYIYEGICDCDAAARLGGGFKACAYGCLGLGNCAKICPFDAIAIEDGVANVNPDKCTGCGKCTAVCPKNVIVLIPKTAKYYVSCASKNKGAEMKDKCSSGCIGCKICEKNCSAGAILVENNLAEIDYDKCTNCGLCAEKCPKKIIRKGILG
ncbi:MAG: RnfABCDGE type electron transport complex subunit B [Clostridia bacterium]|nr:RnfABCDGE type electron transport complex subunit B [Clostridia bacterium]